MANKESGQQKEHLKTIWKDCPQIKSGEPPEPPPPQTLLISSLALGSSILLLIC